MYLVAYETIKTGCAWQAVFQPVSNSEHPDEDYKWDVVVTNNYHVHEAATDASVYARNSSLNTGQETMVANTTEAGVSPRKTIATLRSKLMQAVRQDIQNTKP